MHILRRANYAAILKKLRHPEKRTWIILNPASIGETVMICAFAKAFVETHGYGITMVVRPEHFSITQMYPDRFEQIIEVEGPEMTAIMRYLPTDQFELDVPFAGFVYSLGDARSDRLTYLFKYPGRGGLSYNDVVRHILMLPWDACMERPKVRVEWEDEARQYAAEVGIEPGKSVLLFPANTSGIKQFPDIFWSTVVARLKENGYKVFCNMKGGVFMPQTMPIAGSIPIEVPLHLGLSLVSIAGRMISAPHGFQYLQLMGGNFDNLTSISPVSTDLRDFELNGRTYSTKWGLHAYMCPELCANLPDRSYAEFMAPFDGSEEELRQVAIAVADLDLHHPKVCRRLGPTGRPFNEENIDWLTPLIEPRPARKI
jgi:hypothetical protein